MTATSATSSTAANLTASSTAGTTSTAAATGSGEMCRLIVYGPASRVELAVPAHVPLGDLMPTVLGHLDPALATSGLGHGGWVVQRLGEPPLDEDQGTAGNGLYDGDVLHLRPRDDQLPLVDFDDLVDGVHTGLSAGADLWRPAFTRRACVAVAALAGLIAVFVTTFAGSGAVTAAGAVVIGAVLLGAAIAMDRAFGDRGAVVPLTAVAMVAVGMAGLAVPWGDTAPRDWLSGPGVLAGGAAVAAAAATARAILGVARPGLLAVACAAALTALSTVLGLATGLAGPAAAAVVLAVTLILTKVAPQLAAWLAGLAAEPVPTSPDEFQQRLEPLPSKNVLDKARQADAYLTAFLAVLGAMHAGALLVVASAPRWDTMALTCAAAVLLLLQARELNGTWHRIATLAPAAVGLAGLALVWSARLPAHGQLGVLIGLLLVSALAVTAARVLPGRRLIPRWGRWGDFLHWTCALAIVPLGFAVTGLYGWVTTLM
jgi:type VII secretion integral membrane protein EccD